MRHSESIKELAMALAKAQAQLRPAIKDSANPFFKNKYADLSSVWEACRDALHAHGLAVVQAPLSTEAGAGVETMLLHSSGEWMSETLILPLAKNDPQGAGSAITYARRYALAAFVGVCPEDDDANAASEPLRALRDKNLKVLQGASEQGRKALEAAWKAMSPDARKACQADMKPLGLRADEVDRKAGRQPGEEAA
jgi:hypothetical protein